MKMFFSFLLILLSACNQKSPETQANNALKTASLTEKTPPALPSALESEDYDISTIDLGSGNVGASVTFNEPEQHASYTVGIGEENYEVCGASVTFDCTELGNYTSITLSACNTEGCGPSVPQTLSCPNIENTSEELPPIATILEADQEILALARSFKTEVTNLINSQELTEDARALLAPVVAKADCDIVADFDTILALITEEEKLSTEAIIAIAVGVTTVAAAAVATAVVLTNKARKPQTPAVELDEITNGKTGEAKNMAAAVAQVMRMKKMAKAIPAVKMIAGSAPATAPDADTKNDEEEVEKTQRRGPINNKKADIKNYIERLGKEDLQEIAKYLENKDWNSLWNKLNPIDNNKPPRYASLYKTTEFKDQINTRLTEINNLQLSKAGIQGPPSRVLPKGKTTLHRKTPEVVRTKASLLVEDGPSAFDNFKAYCVALVQEVAELKLLIDIESIKLASGGEAE